MNTPLNHIPELRFKAFSDEWVEKRLGEMATFNPKEVLPHEFEYVDLESVVGTELISCRHETKLTAPSRAQRLARKGDLFYQTVRPYQKNNYLYEKENKNFVFSTGYAQMRPFVDGYFLLSLVQVNKFVKIVLDNCTGTSYPAINARDLANIQMFISTSLPEQEKIGQYFSRLDGLIRLAEEKVKALEKTKQAMLEKMFPKEGSLVPEVRFKGFTEPWVEKKLGEIGEFYSNGVDKIIRSTEIPVNMLNYMDVYNRREVTAKTAHSLMQVTATKEQIKNNNIIAGDVFFTPTSETADDIGHVMVVEEDLINTVYSYHLMRFRPNNGVLYKIFPNSGFETEFVRKQFKLLAKGVQRFVISKSDFSSIRVMLPSLPEQEKIGQYFSRLDGLISLQGKKVEKLKQLKVSLLEKMFVS